MVFQDGARLNYAVPRALEKHGALERVITDWYAAPHTRERMIANSLHWFFPRLSKKLAGRYCQEIKPFRVSSAPILAGFMLFARPWFPSPERYYHWCSKVLANQMVSTGFGKANALFGFVRNVHPAICAYAKRNGLRVVVDQMCAPAMIECSLLAKEMARWSQWESQPRSRNFGILKEVEQSTWASADRITCSSEFVQQGLVECGIEAKKVSINRYPIDVRNFVLPKRGPQKRAVTVGFIGRVEIAKGVPYFVRVARNLANRGLRFVLTGKVNIARTVLADLGKYVEITGPVPRNQVKDVLSEFDIFLFPSVFEGSASAVLEAMASGLPIVTSRSSGTLVQDNVHGFVRAYDDVDGLSDSVERLATDPELRQKMGTAGRLAVQQCILDSFGQRLFSVFTTR